MNLGLTGKVAMVAGASRGIGLAVAKVLASEGAHVSMASRSTSAIEEAGSTIEADTGRKVLAVSADVTSADDIHRWHDATVEQFDEVDLLFTNYGGPPPGTFFSFDDAAWQAGFELILLSVIRMVRAVVPSMQNRGGGAIIMSTSSSVKQPIDNLILSNVMRASVAALSKSLAGELASDGIRVNHAVPGRIATDRLTELDETNARRAGITTEQQKQRVLKEIPLGRYGETEEYAQAVAFLFSDAASYITGATLQVDGGLIQGVL